MYSSWEEKENSYLRYFAVFRWLPTKGTCVFTVGGVRAFINKVATFFFSFSGFIVAFSNFLQGESPGRSALETGSKWEGESLIEFLG